MGEALEIYDDYETDSTSSTVTRPLTMLGLKHESFFNHEHVIPPLLYSGEISLAYTQDSLLNLESDLTKAGRELHDVLSKNEIDQDWDFEPYATIKVLPKSTKNIRVRIMEVRKPIFLFSQDEPDILD